MRFSAIEQRYDDPRMVSCQRAGAIFNKSQFRPAFKKSVQLGCRSTWDLGTIFALLNLRDSTRAHEAVNTIEVEMGLIVFEATIQHRLDQTNLVVGHIAFAPPWHHVAPLLRSIRRKPDTLIAYSSISVSRNKIAVVKTWRLSTGDGRG